MMPVDLSKSLVVGVASSALFDLTESHAVFSEQGSKAYEQFQREHLDDPLAPGPAFAFVQRLLDLNDLQAGLVEILVMSKNSPSSGLRVMRSIEHHRLQMTRAMFRRGQGLEHFMPVFNMSLFLSANRGDVNAAVAAGQPAGHVLPNSPQLEESGRSLRLAFDFDGVLADDSSERVYQEGTLDEYFEYEKVHAGEALKPGPLEKFLRGINHIQRLEADLAESDPSYERRVRVSLVTARNAPAHERAVRSLMEWGVEVDDAFFLGGISKTGVLNTLRPHLFFDDQLRHLEDPELTAPAVHIPFGVHNVSPKSANSRTVTTQEN